MKNILVINADVCTGCRTCEAVCSSRHGGEINPLKSRIQVIKWEKSGIDMPMICQQCEDPICKSVCPVDAIHLDEKTGAWLIAEDKCIGCRMCVVTCPFGAVSFDTEKNKAVKCDLCEGDPMCVKFCSTSAIQFIPSATVSLQKRREAAGKIEELIKKVAVSYSSQ